ncbi:MAG: hypothetical protein II481_00805, partial [Clostridia bacterium]|nr:hypothetical protein [Clostridia bacterium]
MKKLEIKKVHFSTSTGDEKNAAYSVVNGVETFLTTKVSAGFFHDPLKQPCVPETHIQLIDIEVQDRLPVLCRCTEHQVFSFIADCFF